MFGQLDGAVEQWAQDAIVRATKTSEPEDHPFVANSTVPDHPCIFAAKGLAAMVRRERKVKAAGEHLLRLAVNPLQAVSSAALAEAMSCWDVDANFAWTAFDLGLRLSIGRFDEQPLSFHYDQRANRRTNAKVLKLALRRLRACCLDYTLVEVPNAWVQVEAGARRKRTAGPPLPENSNWSEPETFLRYDYLPKCSKGSQSTRPFKTKSEGIHSSPSPISWSNGRFLSSTRRGSMKRSIGDETRSISWSGKATSADSSRG